MNEQLRTKCDLLIANKQILSRTFKFDSSLMSLAAASIYMSKNIIADTNTLKQCNKLVKSKASVFSNLRGNSKLPLICKMSLKNNPEVYFTQVKNVYKMLSKNNLLGSEYKVLAAMTICDHLDDKGANYYIDKTNAIYSRMKANHRFLTSDEDFPFAAILAMSDYDIESLVIEMEKDYNLLREKFHSRNAVQSLSHILALDSQDANLKCSKVIRIFEQLKSLHHKFGTGIELASLGALSLIDLPENEIVNAIIEVDEYLKLHKGFGNMSLGKKTRRLYAAQIVADT